MNAIYCAIRPITDDRQLDIAKKIYFESFPVTEQRPWSKILESNRQPSSSRPKLDGVFKGEELIGLVTTWHFPELLYVEHLAIEPSMRGKNIGSSVVESLKGRARRAGLPLVLEVEPSDSSKEAARRIGFYERNGLKVITKDYIQPPYEKGLPSVPMWIMATADIDSRIIEGRLHRDVYGITL